MTRLRYLTILAALAVLALVGVVPASKHGPAPDTQYVLQPSTAEASRPTKSHRSFGDLFGNRPRDRFFDLRQDRVATGESDAPTGVNTIPSGLGNSNIGMDLTGASLTITRGDKATNNVPSTEEERFTAQATLAQK